MIDRLRQRVKGTFLEPIARSVINNGFKRFRTSGDYWEGRYRAEGNSGSGSYGRLSVYKADFLNTFVASNQIHSVIEFGCGDGNQLELSKYEQYLGFDISKRAIEICQARFQQDNTKEFKQSEKFHDQVAELVLSLDVIYHLVEDDVFHAYMEDLFKASCGFVIIYSTNFAGHGAGRTPHVKHRKFSDWVDAHAKNFTLMAREPNLYPFDPADPDNTSLAEFFVYGKNI